MYDLNIEFLEKYKKLEKLLNEMYSSARGVNDYILDMEKYNYDYAVNKINNWDETYKNLKHSRWMRNQLAHDVPIYSELCEQSDVNWIDEFYCDLFNYKDPLALFYKIKRENSNLIKNNVAKENDVFKKEDKSFFEKIIEKIKKLIKL